MKSDEMAKMFDVDLPTLNTGESASSEHESETSSVSFEQRVGDVQSVLEAESPADETVAIKAEEVMEPVPDPKPESESSNIQPDVSPVAPINEKNPLGLVGEDLSAYHRIREQYPQFTLYDGSIAFRDFYQWKVRMLKNVLTRFPLLPVQDLRSELREIGLDHYVGSDRAIPELLRQKLDDVYRCRTRLVALLLDAYEQLPAWKRVLEMLQSKLSKDHAQRGAHNREALVLEHLSDVACYAAELEGYTVAGKHIDHMLQAAAESLSRQLSCIQLKEPTGTSFHETASECVTQVGSGLDELDSIDDGTVINKPQATGSVVEEDFGVSKPDAVVDMIG